MANAVVFLFVLETVQGFNETLNNHILEPYKNGEKLLNIKRCKPHSSDLIIDEIGKALNVNLLPPWNKHQLPIMEHSPSSDLYNSDELLDLSFPEVDQSLIDDINYLEQKLNGIIITSKEITQNENAMKRVIAPALPETTPFLAAIFETLSNVTALTCAATLVSPYWVVTAANCVNMLGCSSTDADGENATVVSKYTIVVGTTNPVLDGIPHNVAQIMFPPEINSQESSSSSNIVLLKSDLKMEFENQVKYVKIADKFDGISNVKAYGWMESQIRTEHEIGSVQSAMLTVLSPAQCQENYNFTEVMCLKTASTGSRPEMNPGGPVLVIEEQEVRMLAVVLADDSAEGGHYIVYPLVNHVDWLNKVIAA